MYIQICLNLAAQCKWSIGPAQIEQCIRIETKLILKCNSDKELKGHQASTCRRSLLAENNYKDNIMSNYLTMDDDCYLKFETVCNSQL